MPNTSTGGPRGPGDQLPAAEREATRGSDTHPNMDGQAAPRLPHERDESSDSGTRPPDERIRQAADDVQSGKVSTDRGEVTNELYGRTLREPSNESEPPEPAKK